MTKHRRHNRRTIRRQRGGELAGNPPSSWGWGMGTLGNGWTQFMNSLTLQPGQNFAASQSNNSVPNVHQGNTKSLQGGRRNRHNTRRSRGGNIGAVLSQAAVPGTLLLLNQSMKRRRHRRR